MWKWFIGPALVGTGWLAGSVYGRDAEQLAHKSPDDTYAAVEQALGDMPESGTTSFDGGTSMPYQIHVDRTPERQLLVALSFAGRQGAQAEFDFAPQEGGKATLITVQIRGDHQVLRQVLAGTSRARLAYAPDWMLNLAARPLLAEIAQEIDRGEMARFTGPTSQGEAEAQWEQNLSDEQRNDVQEWRQYDATRPTSDPDSAAETYMNQGE
jgi:hypothetical protein